MRRTFNQLIHKFLVAIFAIAVFSVSAFGIQVATLSPTLQSNLSNLTDNADVGLTIVVFNNTTNGVQESHLNILRSVGITAGEVFPNLGMAAMPLTAGQVRVLQNNNEIRSIWSNDKMHYYLEEAKVMTGVNKARIDSGFMARNGSFPVDGSGDFSIMVIDSGVDVTPGPVNGTISQIKFNIPNVADISGHDNFEDIDFALKNRLIDIYSDGSFRPTQNVTRADFATSLLLNTNLRQTVGGAVKFSDVSGDLARIAESVTTNGANIRDYGFDSTSLMTSSDSTFNPNVDVERLAVAVAFVKALGHDEAAHALAGSTVMFEGVPLSDNAQIPNALRGYVQLAINKGLFEAFPAEVRQLPNGTFQALPGPRFEPNSNLNRADFASRLKVYNQLFTTGG